MKNFTFLSCVLLVLLAGSCKKDADGPGIGSLAGKWQVLPLYFSPATAGTVQPLPASESYYVQFYINGILGGNQFPDYKSYKADGSVITFYDAGNSSYNYSYTLKNDTLVMKPKGVDCTHGCGITLVKEK